MDDLFNDIMQSVEAALDASEQLQQFTNYGKLNVDVEYIQWVKKQPSMVDTKTYEAIEIDAKTYRGLPASQKQMNVLISVDIQEFKPQLDFSYNRKVKLSGDGWYNILQPSVAEVFGIVMETSDDISKDDAKRNFTRKVAEALFGASGKYVFVNDVPNKKGKTYNGKVLKVPALTNVFESREDMLQAVRERFGSLPEGVVSGNTPTAYNEGHVQTVNVLKQSGMSSEEIAKQIDGLTVSDVKKILGE